MQRYKDNEFGRIVTERELEQEWKYCECEGDFYDWLDKLIANGTIEYTGEEN